MEQRLIEETQADLYAGFFAHMAGYKALPIASQTLDIIYKAYALDSNLTGYPSLYDRQSIARGKMKELAELALIFNVGNLALVTRNYSESTSCYEYILKKEFTSREIYNNLGLSKLYKAVSFLGETIYKFYLPTLMDPETRGPNSPLSNLSDTEKIEKAKELLESSIYYFKTATTLDEGYTPSKVNMSTALVLLSSLDSNYHNKMLKSFDAISLTEKNNLLGIYYALKEDSVLAKKYMQNGVDANNSLAKLNLGLFEQKKEGRIKEPKKIIIDEVNIEKIAAIGLDKPYLRFSRVPFVNLKVKKLSESIIYTFGNGKVIQESDSSQFIGLKLSLSKVNNANIIEKYGMPENLISTFRESYYIYNEIIIVLDNTKGKLKQIIIFN